MPASSRSTRASPDPHPATAERQRHPRPDYGWRVRLIAANAGVLALLVVPAALAWRAAAWTAVPAGLGTFPVLVAAALATARRTRTRAEGRRRSP